MAYENQGKCIRCGKSIPPMPEDARMDELFCDRCHQIREDVENEKVDLLKAMQIIRGLAECNALDPEYYFDIDEALYRDAVMQEKCFEVFDNFVNNAL